MFSFLLFFKHDGCFVLLLLVLMIFFIKNLSLVIEFLGHKTLISLDQVQIYSSLECPCIFSIILIVITE